MAFEKEHFILKSENLDQSRKLIEKFDIEFGPDLQKAFQTVNAQAIIP